MGYPMTFKRLINRNGLAEGGYDDAGRWALGVNVDNAGLLTGGVEELRQLQVPHMLERLRAYEHGARMMLGDLRRLEQDAVDEGATAQHIAARTGLDADTVAAVLKEFIAW